MSFSEMSRGPRTPEVGERSGAHHDHASLCPLCEVSRQFGVPCPGLFRHCALGCHPLFNCPAPVVTLVRLHRPRLPKGSSPKGTMRDET
jgi:hypothetical protein